MEDITKTGPRGLKGLPGLSKREQMDELIRRDKQSRLSGNTTPESVLSEYQASPIENVGIDLMNKGYGNTWHDDDAMTESQIADLNEFRADKQGFFEQVGKGLAKGVLLAGTTFLDGTIGLLVGGVTAAQENRWSGLWDNEFSRAMQSFNDWAEEALPNYYSREELEDPWYKHILSGNFIGDKFIKNLGFTVGAFYSGGLEVGAIKGLGKLAMGTAKSLGASISALKNISKTTSFTASALGALGSAVNEGRIEALNNSRDWYKVQKQNIDEDYNDKRAMYEALGDYNSLTKLDKNYQATMTELEEDRQRMGNMDLLMNIPILTFSNLIQFGKLYANGFRTGRRASRIAGNLTDGYAGKTTRAAGWRKAIANSLSEGTEEITQKMASTISGDYYEDSISNYYNARVNPEAEQRTVDWIKSFAQGINETVNEGSSWEEFFIGSLTGALGIPMFRGAKGADGKFRSPITLQGGIIGELRENKEQMEREAKIADYMNQRVQDPKFKDYYQGLIRHDFYQEQMDEAVEQGNEFEFKNAEFAQFISDINMFDNAGKLEDLTTLINSAYDTSDENLESIVKNTTNVTTREQQVEQINQVISRLQQLGQEAQASGDNKALNDINNEIQRLSIEASNVKDTYIGPFTNKDGSAIYSTEQGKKDMIEKLTQTKNEMISQIDNYVKTKMDILESVGESISDDQLSELTFLKTQVDNWQERAKNMTGDVLNILKEAKAVFRNINDPEKGKKSDYTETIKSINDLISRTPEEATAILTNPKNQGFVDAIGITLNIFGGSTIGGLQKAQVLDKLTDLKKIGVATEVYNKKFEEYLKNPSKQAERQARDNQQQQENQNTREAITQLDNLRNSSASDIVNQVESGAIDFDRIESLLNDADIEGAEDIRSTANNARDIIDTYNDSVSKLDDMASRGEISEQEKNDIAAMLNDSKRRAENGDEVLDVEGESFNDFRLLNMEEDNAAVKDRAEKEGWSEDDLRQALDDIRNKRLDNAKEVVRSFADERQEKKKALSRLPEGSVETSETTGTNTTSKSEQTGHDSVDRNEPVNKPEAPKSTELTNAQMSEKMLKRANLDPSRNQQIAKAVTNILDYVDTAIKKGMKAKDIKNLVLGTSSWKKVTQGGPKLMKTVTDAVNYKFKNRNNPVGSQDNNVNKETKTDDVQTPLIPVETINNQIEEQNKASYDITGVSKGPDGKYHYWRLGTTEFKIHREKGDDSPYWTTMPASVQKIYKEIHDFLKKEGAFDRVRNNQVKEEDTVRFAISKELNQKAGVTVVLMIDQHGNVIGNLPIPNDSTFNDYIGLADFYNEISQMLNDGKLTGDNDIIIIPGYQSKVSKNLIGKPQYTKPDERHTLNEINTVESSEGGRKSVPFKLGIAVGEKGSNRLRVMATPGRSKNQGTSNLERDIQQPLSMVHGQPFMLMPTSSKSKPYVTVPIMMPVFDINNPAIANSSLGKEVIALVNELATISTNKDKLMAWTDRFKELMAYEEVYVDVDSITFDSNGRSEKFVVRVKNSKSDAHWTTLYSGKQSDCVDIILNNLSQGNGVFNVNRKYINTTYKGKDYNRMIGELAETNLPIGATHTINDWFTIDPIVAGKQEKAKNPKSTKSNTNATQGSRVTVTDGRGNIYYLTSSNRLYKENPNGHDPELIDPRYNNIKAHAWGIRMNEPMTRPYNSPWGMYNPQTGKFEDVEEKPVAVPKIEGEVANQIRESSSKISFNNDDHSYSINGQPIDMSVTQYVHRNDNIEKEAPGVLGYLELSGRIGTEVDTILRNYFEGKIYNSPLFTAKQNRYVREQAKKLKDSLDTMFGKGSWKAITDENMLRVSGVIQTNEGLKSIAGTMDMLIQDKEGNFHIIDFKTKRSNVSVAISGNNKVNYDSQVSLYAALAQINNPLLKGKIAGSFLAVFNPFYQTPKGSRSNERGNITYTEQNGSIIATDWSLGGKIMNLHETQGFNPGTFSQLQVVDWNADMVASVKGNIRTTRSNTQSQPQSGTQSQQRITEVKLPSGPQINLGMPSQMSATDFYFKDGKIDDYETIFKAVKTSDGIQFIPSVSAGNILSTENIKGSMEVHTDTMPNEVSNSTIIKVVSLGEAKLENGRYVITKKPVVIISNNQDFIDKTLDRLNGNESNNQSSTKATSTTQTYSKFEDAAIITSTSEGYREVTDIQDWSRSSGDIRTQPDGWGTYNGLTYYKRSISGRAGDNTTIWLKTPLTEEGKKLLEQEFNKVSKVADENKARILEIINNNQSTEATSSSRKSTVEPVVALQWLLDDGIGTIKALEYFMFAVQGAFPSASKEIEGVINRNRNIILGKEASVIQDIDNENILNIRNALTEIVDNHYGEKGLEILNKLISNSTGFLPKIGNEVGKEIEELKPVSKPIEVAPAKPAVVNEVSREEALNTLKSYKVLNNKVRQTIAEKLSDDRLAKLASMKKLRVQQIFGSLDTVDVSNSDAVNQAFDRVTGAKPLNRVAEQEIQEAKNWSMQSELKKIRKVLPQLSMEGRIKLVKGLIRIAESADPQYAYGQFQNGVITLSSESARGTVYHEAFHFVTQTLLSPEELMKLYESYGIAHSLNKSLEIEENMAEDFRRYMQSYEDGNFFSNTFRTLKHIIKTLFGKSTLIDRVFYDIRRGKLANRAVRQETSNQETNPLYKQTEKEQSNVIQQYHRQKLDYGNLNQEQRNYIDERGLTIEEYNSMTPQEKEVLFRCMY